MRSVNLSALALVSCAGLAVAQPAAFTDLGTHTGVETFSQEVSLLSSNDIQWFRIVLPAVGAASANYVDMWTSPTIAGVNEAITDAEMGLYDNSGNRIANDDDDSDIVHAQLSFGSNDPTRPAVGTGEAFAGEDGDLAGGTYWVAVGRFGVTFNDTAWDVFSNYTGTQRDVLLNFNIQPNAILSGRATIAPTSVSPGGSMLATIDVTPGTNPASTGIAVSMDMSSVGGSATQALNDAGTNGDATAGDGTYSYAYTIPNGTPGGSRALPWTISDSQGRSFARTSSVLVLGAGVFGEAEPNDTKDAATPAMGMAVGNVVLGLSTGTSTTTAGDGSADYFRIKTAPAPLGIYKYTLSLSSDTPGHAATIRGLSQTGDGVINVGTDIAAQTGFTAGDASRVVSWYGFGKEEELYYRVTGTASTTSGYASSLARESVARQSLATSPSTGGQYTIRVTAAGATTDPEIWVLNGTTLDAIPDFNNDDTTGSGLVSTLSRQFDPGSYVLVLSDYNLQCNLPSPSDEAFRGENVTDFPNVFVASDRETGDVTLTVEIHEGDINGPIITTESFTQSGDFAITFVDMNVGGGNTCVADFDDGSFTGTRDGAVTVDDLLYYLDLFGNGDVRADVDNGTSTGTQDQAVTIDDLLYFLVRFDLGC